MRTTWQYDSGLCKELGRADMPKIVNYRYADLETKQIGYSTVQTRKLSSRPTAQVFTQWSRQSENENPNVNKTTVISTVLSFCLKMECLSLALVI